MSTIGGFKKQTVIVICSVILISLFVVSVSYSNFSNIGSATNNTVITNYPVTTTFKESNFIKEELEVFNENDFTLSGKPFSVLNESEDDIKYEILIKVLDDNVVSIDNILISLDGADIKNLSSFVKKSDAYIIGSNVLRHKNDVSDVATHNIRIWTNSSSSNNYASLEIVVEGKSANNILTKKILNDYSKENIIATNGLFVDNFSNTRYYGENPNNYVMFNNELWRIIGVFNITTNNNREEQRVKLIRNDSLVNVPFSLSNSSNFNSNIGSILNSYVSGVENRYITNFLSEESKNLISPAVYNFGSLVYNNDLKSTDIYDNELNSYDPFDRDISLGLDVGLLNISDYYFASLDKSKGNYLNDGSDYWLLNYDSKNINSAYFINVSGDLVMDSTINSHNIRPVVYLKSTVTVVKGDGTLENPYILE